MRRWLLVLGAGVILAVATPAASPQASPLIPASPLAQSAAAEDMVELVRHRRSKRQHYGWRRGHHYGWYKQKRYNRNWYARRYY